MSIARPPVRVLTRAAAALAAGTLILATAQPVAASSSPPTPLSFLVNHVNATSVSMQWSPGYLTAPTRWQVFQDGALASTRYNSAYTATGLTPGETYSFFIVAVDSDGDTAPPTRTITVTTRGDGVEPGAPSGPRATELAPARVTIEFDRPGDEFDVHSYAVFDGSQQVAVVGRTPYAHPTASVTVRHLAPGSTHTFTVRANRAGGLSAPSQPLTVTTPTTTDATAPTMPTGLAGSLAPYTCDLADLTWNPSTDDQDAPAAIDYEIFVNGSASTAVRGTGAAFSVLLPGPGAHEVTVRAVDSSGNASAHGGPATVVVDPHCQP